MPKLLFFSMKGPHPAETAIQHASPRAEFNRVIDTAGEVAPQAVIENVGVKSRRVIEPATRAEDRIVDQVSTFYHDMVPIPWLHGGERMTG